MQHVGKSLYMHQAVLYRHIQKLIAFRGRLSCEGIINAATRGYDVIAHALNGWPIFRLIRGKPATNRIDAESKKAIKLRIERLELQYPFPQQVPVERLQMTDVKHNAMPFGDRAFINKFRFYNAEQFIRLAAGLLYAFQQYVIGGVCNVGGSHDF